MGSFGCDRNSKLDVGMFTDKNALESIKTLDKSKSPTKLMIEKGNKENIKEKQDDKIELIEENGPLITEDLPT
jgi:hypothetical protein